MTLADRFHSLTPWEFSPAILLICLASAICYWRGCKQYPSSLLQRSGFWLGLALFYTAFETQFEYYAEHAFFIHRIQHMMLHFIGPLLLVLSRPAHAIVAGMPLRLRTMLQNILRFPTCAVVIDLLNHPLIAVLLLCSQIGFWLLPPVHAIAMLDWRYTNLMNWSIAINGLMFWGVVLHNFALRPTRLSPGIRIGMMLAIIPPQITIGMAIFSAPHLLYPLYELCGRAFDGISALEDQQLGGIIVWLHAAMMSVLGIILVVNREWMRDQSAC